MPVGGTIRLKHGIHEIQEPIVVTKNVTILGDQENPDLVILQGGEKNVFHLKSGFAKIVGVTVKNEGKEGCSSADNDAIQFSAPLGVLRKCVFMSRYGSGITVNAKGSNPSVTSCTARDCGLSGFNIGSGASGIFHDCTVSGNARAGMWVQDVWSNPTVEGCTFENNQECGVRVNCFASGTFRRNKLSNTKNWEIKSWFIFVGKKKVIREYNTPNE